MKNNITSFDLNGSYVSICTFVTIPIVLVFVSHFHIFANTVCWSDVLLNRIMHVQRMSFDGRRRSCLLRYYSWIQMNLRCLWESANKSAALNFLMQRRLPGSRYSRFLPLSLSISFILCLPSKAIFYFMHCKNVYGVVFCSVVCRSHASHSGTCIQVSISWYSQTLFYATKKI